MLYKGLQSNIKDIHCMIGIEREFLLRFWTFLGTTITQATEIYVEREKLNSFMDRGLIKVIQKGDTTGEELKNWHPITLLLYYQDLR